jgi:hypothetical protein
MKIANPKKIAGFGTTFPFPFQTIEDVVVILDDKSIAVLNDSDFPFSSGRIEGKAGNNEWITIDLPKSPGVDKRVLK